MLPLMNYFHASAARRGSSSSFFFSFFSLLIVNFVLVLIDGKFSRRARVEINSLAGACLFYGRRNVWQAQEEKNRTQSFYHSPSKFKLMFLSSCALPTPMFFSPLEDSRINGRNSSLLSNVNSSLLFFPLLLK